MATTNLTTQPNVNNSSVVLAAQPSEMVAREMSSLEIAEITGKQHSHVMRDIRNMVETLKKSNESTSGLVDCSEDYHRGERNQYKYLSPKTQKAILDFAFNDSSSPYVIEESSYKDEKGELRTMYSLNKKASLLLASGYSVTLRARIIDRWELLESGKATPLVLQPKQQLTMKDKLTWIKEVQKMLKLNDASTLGLLQQVADPLGLPVPQYVDSKGILISATAALFDYQTGIKVNEFNKRMIEKGFLEELSRKSSKGIVKMFKHITPSGLKYGENQVNPKSPQQTQPLYYKHKFPELLKELELK